MNVRRSFIKSVLACAAMALAFGASADTYPNKPIKVIVPFPPGGGVDLYARIIQNEMAKRLGQPIVIENRPGASGMIGVDAVAKAAPDGYTLVFGNIATFAMNVGIYQKMTYHPLKDLTPIMQTVMVPYVLVVNPELPVKNVADLITYSKANPAKVSYGSSGSGSGQHLAAELFKAGTKAPLTHVPYKGVGALVSDLIAGHVQVAFVDLASMMPHIKTGKLRLLATAGARRSADIPDVPTIAEAANLPGFEISGWQGISGPAGLPPAVAQRLNQVLNSIQQDPAIEAKLTGSGLTPVGGTPAEFTAYMQAEITKWSKVAKDIGATVD